MSTDDVAGTTANDVGGANDLLSPMEGTDSDDTLAVDGDDVLDPPDGWSGVDKFGMSAQEQADGETLDQRLSEEVPDVTPVDVDTSEVDTSEVDDVDVDDVSIPGPDAAPDGPGVHRGQVDGVPEDGDSLFTVAEGSGRSDEPGLVE